MDVLVGCLCPPLDDAPRHPDGDTVTLRDTLDFRAAASIRSAVAFATSDDESARTLEILALLTESYLLFGITAWTLLDERGGPLPVTHGAIRERVLVDVEAASILADKADDLYSGIVLLPLLARASTSSPPTSTASSTSAPTASSRKRPRRSSRSSTTSTPMDGTATTSSWPGGVSSTSPSARSAG